MNYHQQMFSSTESWKEHETKAKKKTKSSSWLSEIPAEEIRFDPFEWTKHERSFKRFVFPWVKPTWMNRFVCASLFCLVYSPKSLH